MNAELETRIRDFLKLENDWDGFGGVSPSQQTVNDVIVFIDKLPTNGIPPAKLMLASDGIIGLYWDNKNNYIDICFFGDGTFWYYARDDKNHEIGADNISLKTDIPKELLDYLTI